MCCWQCCSGLGSHHLFLSFISVFALLQSPILSRSWRNDERGTNWGLVIFVAVLGGGDSTKHRRLVILRTVAAFGLLCVWKLCRRLLAINHEDEITVHSRGIKKHDHELLPNSSQSFCLRCALQCKFESLIIVTINSHWHLIYGVWQWLLLLVCLFAWHASHLALLQVSAFPIAVMFGMCAIFLIVAAVLQRRLHVVAEKQQRLSKFCHKAHQFMTCNLYSLPMWMKTVQSIIG